MKFVTVVAGVMVLLSACNEAPTVMPGSVTFFVSEQPNEVGQCGDNTDARDMQPGINGSTWRWKKTDDVSGLLFCQRNKSGLVSAWREVSKDGKATHSLQFAPSKTLFQPN